MMGGFFRRLADFFDRLGTNSSPATESRARFETEIIALSVAFVGIVAIGTFKLGWGFFFWIFGFALFFTGGVRFIFRVPQFSPGKRNALVALFLLLSIIAASERILGVLCFVTLAVLLLGFRLWQDRAWYRGFLALTMVLLFCFVGYAAFSGVLAWQRNSALKLKGILKADCKYSSEHLCTVLETRFSVPEFWLRSRRNESKLIDDLSAVSDLHVYSDSATENAIAHAAFSVSPEVVVEEISRYFSLQKGFLQSRTEKGTPLVLQPMMKGPDAELYAVIYESETRPGYLADRTQSTAIVLLHQRRGVTWLFVIDGHDLTSREFLLHRIISGFR